MYTHTRTMFGSLLFFLACGQVTGHLQVRLLPADRFRRPRCARGRMGRRTPSCTQRKSVPPAARRAALPANLRARALRALRTAGPSATTRRRTPRPGRRQRGDAAGSARAAPPSRAHKKIDARPLASFARKRHVFKLGLFGMPATPTARLAQSAERKTLNLVVVGSSPTLGDHSGLLAVIFGTCMGCFTLNTFCLFFAGALMIHFGESLGSRCLFCLVGMLLFFLSLRC